MGFITIKPPAFGRICLELLPSIMLKGDGWKQLKNTGDEVMIEGSRYEMWRVLVSSNKLC